VACPVQHHGNQGEVFDCDEYAMTLKSRLAFLAMQKQDITGGHPIATGIFWGKASWDTGPLHAGNWFVTRNNKLVWIEPQYNNAKAKQAGNNPIRPTQDMVTQLKLMIY
jgi:hypothetical protein